MRITGDLAKTGSLRFLDDNGKPLDLQIKAFWLDGRADGTHAATLTVHGVGVDLQIPNGMVKIQEVRRG